MNKDTIYLIQPAELIGTNRYKIGHLKSQNLTKNPSFNKKGIRILCLLECDRVNILENKIRIHFNSMFKLVAGNNCFEGNEKEIIMEFIKKVTNHNENNDDKLLEYHVRKTLGQKLFITKDIDDYDGIINRYDLNNIDSDFYYGDDIILKIYDHLKFDFNADDDTTGNKQIIELFTNDFNNDDVRVVIHSYKGCIYAFIVSIDDYMENDYWSKHIDQCTDLPYIDYIDYSGQGTVDILKDLIIKMNTIYK